MTNKCDSVVPLINALGKSSPCPLLQGQLASTIVAVQLCQLHDIALLAELSTFMLQWLAKAKVKIDMAMTLGPMMERLNEELRRQENVAKGN